MPNSKNHTRKVTLTGATVKFQRSSFHIQPDGFRIDCGSICRANPNVLKVIPRLIKKSSALQDALERTPGGSHTILQSRTRGLWSARHWENANEITQSMVGAITPRKDILHASQYFSRPWLRVLWKLKYLLARFRTNSGFGHVTGLVKSQSRKGESDFHIKSENNHRPCKLCVGQSKSKLLALYNYFLSKFHNF